MGEIRILDVGEADRWREAGGLIFEYIAATEAELGHPVPAHHADLPSSLATECDNARSAYPPPGTVLAKRPPAVWPRRLSVVPGARRADLTGPCREMGQREEDDGSRARLVRGVGTAAAERTGRPDVAEDRP